MSGSTGQVRGQLQTRALGGTAASTEVEAGVISVATGGREGTTTRYLHGQDERVVTQLELEEWIAHQPERVADLKHLVMIQCVESDEVGYFYCSRTCCTSTMKNAIRVKMLNPECQVTVLYKDIITYGFREQYYTDARQRGVLFVRYTDELPPQVTEPGKPAFYADPGLDFLEHAGDPIGQDCRVGQVTRSAALQRGILFGSRPQDAADGLCERGNLSLWHGPLSSLY